MVIDWTISIGNILTILIIAGTFLTFAYRSGKFSQQVSDMQRDMSDMKEVQKDVSKVLTGLAVQDNRIQNQDNRLTRNEAAIEDIRHGRGFIQPLGLLIDRAPS